MTRKRNRRISRKRNTRKRISRRGGAKTNYAPLPRSQEEIKAGIKKGVSELKNSKSLNNKIKAIGSSTEGSSSVAVPMNEAPTPNMNARLKTFEQDEDNYLEDYPSKDLKELSKLDNGEGGLNSGFIDDKTPSDKLLKLIERVKGIKDLKYQMRDLSNGALATQVKIWRTIDKETTTTVKGTLWNSTAKALTKTVLTDLEKENTRREKERKTYYEALEPEIYSYLDNKKTEEGGAIKLYGTSQEVDSFLKKSVRLMRHIEELKENKDARFLARILICLVKKYHGASTPFITQIDVAKEVNMENIKNMIVVDGMKPEDVSILKSKLKTMQTYLSCSSKLSKAKRAALCNEEDLKGLLFPGVEPDMTKITSIMATGLKRDKQKVIEDIALLLTILTGKACELVGMEQKNLELYKRFSRFIGTSRSISNSKVKD